MLKIGLLQCPYQHKLKKTHRTSLTTPLGQPQARAHSLQWLQS